jgi:acetoacetate decarboxylase
MPFPAPPWDMQGQLWLTLFRSKSGGGERRPPGVYGVALVDYQPGSELTYHELLVARRVAVKSGRDKGRHVTIADIWVDSVESVQGGRALWAFPKDLAVFDWSADQRRGSVEATVSTQTQSPATSGPGQVIATAEFSAPRLLMPRVPFSGSTWQPRDDSAVVAKLKGSSRSFPVKGSWTFDPDGPLAWLTGAKPLASVVMRDFRMSFG